MPLNTANIKASTQAMVGSLVVLGSLFQIPVVHDFLLAQAAGHPHLLGVLGTVFGVIGLLHNPQVQAVLHAQGKPDWMTTTKVVDANQQQK